MKHGLLLTAALAIFFWGAVVPAHSTTYFVSKTGNDSSNCTSTSTSCLTIGHAQTLAVSPGDVVQVGAGTYTENVTLSHSGSASGGNIIFRGQDGTGCPTTSVSDVNNPTGTRPASTAIVVGNFKVVGSYLTIDCFHFKSNGGGGIGINANISNTSITNNEIDGNGVAANGGGIGFTGNVPSTQYAKNFTISRNYIHGVSSGLWFWCSSCTVSDNEITALAGDEPGSDHDYIDAWGIGSVFKHNYMHDNTCNSCKGYDCHMDCIQTWNTTGDGTEVSQNITFDRNVCFNHHEGVIVQDNAGNGDVSNWTVTNNVFAYGPYDDGSGNLCQAGTVHPWCWVFEDGQLGTNNLFWNNTCIDGAEGFRNNSGSASFKDNLYYSVGTDSSVYDTSGATTSGANNLYYVSSGTFGKGTYSGDITDKNPALVSVGSGSSSERCIGCNFNIQSTSAAKDAGVATSPTVTTDLLGNARPQGPAFDIGAYEFVVAQTQKPNAPTGLVGTAH
jgi:hypothetical protein